MKSALIIILLSQLPYYSNAQDTNVCNLLSQVVDQNQDRFDQAEEAIKNKDQICKDEANPKLCLSEIEVEFSDAKKALEKSKIDYHNAGCDQ